ncbi:RDD family protein [Halobium salinum]|uniref:RDD family protein n=1 Tax=Halobium salinum TaxID=1364940 RepID=A0ABD5P7D9_9EURY|nr:RDD family protein [Halobium salinum]
MGDLSLRLFGAIHIDRVGKVETELAELAAGDDAGSDTVGALAADDAAPDDAPDDPNDAPTAPDDAPVDPNDAPAAPDDAPADSDDTGPVDAVFVEYPNGEFDLRGYLRFVLRVPAVAVGWGVVTVVHVAFYLLFQRDVVPAEVVAATRYAREHDRPLHAVDDHPVHTLAAAGPAWVVASWLALAGLLWVTRLDGAVTAAALAAAPAPLFAVRDRGRTARVGAGLTVVLGAAAAAVLLGLSTVVAAAGVLAVLAMLLLTLGPRNRTMLERCRDIAAREGYERAVLTTGKAHVNGMLAVADEVGVRIDAVHRSKWLRHRSEVGADPTVHRRERAAGGGTGRGTGGADEPDGTAESPDLGVGTETDVTGARVAAAVVDALVLVVFSPAFGVGLGVLTLGVGGGNLAVGVVAVVGTLLGPVVYGTLLELRYGKTVGKKLFGLAVVDEDGTALGRRGVLARNVGRLADGIGFYLVGLAVMLLTNRRQRLGDLLGSSVVVRSEF